MPMPPSPSLSPSLRVVVVAATRRGRELARCSLAACGEFCRRRRRRRRAASGERRAASGGSDDEGGGWRAFLSRALPLRHFIVLAERSVARRLEVCDRLLALVAVVYRSKSAARPLRATLPTDSRFLALLVAAAAVQLEATFAQFGALRMRTFDGERNRREARNARARARTRISFLVLIIACRSRPIRSAAARSLAYCALKRVARRIFLVSIFGECAWLRALDGGKRAKSKKCACADRTSRSLARSLACLPPAALDVQKKRRRGLMRVFLSTIFKRRAQRKIFGVSIL